MHLIYSSQRIHKISILVIPISQISGLSPREVEQFSRATETETTGLSWELSLSDTARTVMHEWRAGEAG